MLTRRNWLLRLSIILNVVVLCYVATHFVTYNNGVELVEDIQATGRNLAVIEYSADLKGQNPHQLLQSSKFFSFPMQNKRSGNASEKIQEGQKEVQNFHDKNAFYDYQTNVFNNKTSDVQGSVEESGKNGESVVMSIPLKTHSVKVVVPSTTQAMLNASTGYAETLASQSGERSLEEVIKCHDRDQKYRTAQRGDFWVLYNYVTPTRVFKCFESVTYTTHADFTFLDNLEPLLERWQGPVSLALHAPGTDFNATLKTIQYLRECGSDLVAELVTFHVYFGFKYVPKKILKPDEVLKLKVNCTLPPPWVNFTSKQLFKTQKKILYPVNVGRNIARESAVTHYVLPSDIELYPSPGVIKDFLDMIRRQDPPLRRHNPKVFPLPIFELEADASVPANKTQLVQMLKKGKAIPFHKKLCSGCHNIPRSREWILTNETEGLHVFHVGKRLGNFIHWEPIYIGTHEEPLYDERLSWEGKSDKMTQTRLQGSSYRRILLQRVIMSGMQYIQKAKNLWVRFSVESLDYRTTYVYCTSTSVKGLNGLKEYVSSLMAYGLPKLGYALCVLDYDFQILDNAFLVHKPGIKSMKKDPARAILASKTNAMIQKIILPELKVIYGTRKGCAV